MPYIRIVVPVVLTLLVSPQSPAQAGTESTFSNYVKTQRISICADSPIPNCDDDFDKPALVAQRLDAEEERARAFEKTGDGETAHEVRVEILQEAIMLDEWLDGLVVRHRKK